MHHPKKISMSRSWDRALSAFGNRSEMLSRAAVLVRDNYNTLLIDLRDSGQRGGNYAGSGYIESRDALGALTDLKTLG